jgi:hypothetical protein
MSRPFARGCIVVREGSYAVVWLDDARGLELLPIVKPRHTMAGDVLLDQGLDLLAFAVSLPGAVVRTHRTPSTGDGYVAVGELPGDRMCEVIQALIRVENMNRFARKWAGDRAHRRNAAARPVRLVGG